MHINLNEHNPLSQASMTLGEVRENHPFISIDLRGSVLSGIIPTTGWFEADGTPCPRPERETNVVVMGFVVPRHGRSLRRREMLSLADRGICPYADGFWNDHVVSFPATKERLEDADAWLKEVKEFGLTQALSMNPYMWSAAFELNGNIPGRHRRHFAEVLRPYCGWV